jgi:hypothetical protein
MPEMPKYLCHKEVWALKISRVETDLEIAEREHRETDDREFCILRTCDTAAQGRVTTCANTIPVRADISSFTPMANSWSPSKAFEEGYTLIS